MRKPRQISKTDIYHIMIRGNNRMNIFNNSNDKYQLLSYLKKYVQQYKVKIYAWCFMNNHVHLVLKSSPINLPKFMKQLCCNYACYFNRKYDRCGHLFQDRYKSEVIENEEYLLAAIRYVMQNPEKAGLCKCSDYQWSSYNEYTKTSQVTDTSLLLEMLGDNEKFIDFVNREENHKFVENINKISDIAAISLLKKYFNRLTDELNIISKEKVSLLINQGISPFQLSRILKINKNTIYKMLS